MLPVLYGNMRSLKRKMLRFGLACSFSMSLTNNKRLVHVYRVMVRHHAPVIIVDELWNHVEAAWTSVHVHAIQSVVDSMPMRISAVFTASGGCYAY
ncbi:hypothetical protein TNCV_2732921 [Trichonephila clavipes]|nr:hypothetical protein TNCV_2732921 [Trichonephila clavipes]